MDKAIRFCDRTVFVCCCLLGYFLPISIALVEVFSTIAIVFFLFKRLFLLSIDLRRRTFIFPRFNSLSLAIVGLVLINALSILTSHYPQVSIKGFFGKTFQDILLFICVVDVLCTPKRIKILIDVFLFSFLVVALSGIFQHLTGVDFILFKLLEHGRVTSSLRSPTDFSAYLAMLTPILFSLMILKPADLISFYQTDKNITKPVVKWKIRAGILILLVLALTCLGVTYARGAWLAVFMAIMVIALCRNRQYLVYVAVLGGIFILFFSARMLVERKHMDPGVVFSTFGRAAQWKVATTIIKDHPLTGIGLNGYSDFVSDNNLNPGGYPHNCYLHMAAEIGIPGLLIFLWMMGSVFREGVINFRKAHSKITQHLLLGSMAGLGAFLFHSFFDTFFYSTQLSALMWMTIGFIVAVGRIDQQKRVIVS